MALTYSEPSSLGRNAPDFSLPGVDGKVYSLADFSASRALVVAFICNHCPYVIAVQGRINQLAREYASQGVRLVAINSNDSSRYPADGFVAMKERAMEQQYAFPYLWDESQEVARAFGAVCTPDFFIFVPSGVRWLEKYRGRLDDNWKDESAVTRSDLAAALDSILGDEEPQVERYPSMGCSIKWK